MIKSKKLTKIKNLKHGFFNNVGGKSKDIYKSLNCGLGSKDLSSNVRKNLEIVKKKINKKAKDIFLINQIHSNKFVYIDDKYKIKKKPKVDAIITNQRNLPIAVLTADCAPILICDKKKNIIAAIHAGWKGAYKGILNKVIKFMIRKGCKLKNITAVIGPSISVKNYEVKGDFKRKFIKKDKENLKYFKIYNNKIYFDLTKYVHSLLLSNKIKNIETLAIDTFDAKNKFFSARRALKLKHNDYGRNISIIMLN
ncbi:peptidoglycan editing factor PgeF [Candidatus Pelagibacter sp.]|nr:peptidoglycan editing factor PgeF [Candidatus Pelagibacter sp.]